MHSAISKANQRFDKEKKKFWAKLISTDIKIENKSNENIEAWSYDAEGVMLTTVLSGIGAKAN